MKKPTLISLFAGIGGFDLAFERHGFETIAQVEIDPSCRRLLEARFPHTKRHDDVTTFDPSDTPCPTVITFGSPCQDLSVAGKRAGMVHQETRSGLFYEAARIIRFYAERGLELAIWENVPGAFSSDTGRDFACVLRAMAECGAVDVAWRVLDAQWFGLAQRRERVFLVADFRAERAAEILSLAQSLSGDSPPRREKGKDITSGVAGCLGGSSQSGGFRTTDLDNNGAFIPTVSPTLRAGANRTGGDRPPGTAVDTADSLIPTLAWALQERDWRGVDSNSKEGHLIPQLNSMWEHGRFFCQLCKSNFGVNDYESNTVTCPKCGNTSCDTINDFLQDGGAVDIHPSAIAFKASHFTRGKDGAPSDVTPPLSCDADKGDQDTLVAFSAKDHVADASIDLSPTLRSGVHKDSHANGGVMPAVAYRTSGNCGPFEQGDKTGALNTATDPAQNIVLQPALHYGVRRLTPLECARLMGFPDWWMDGLKFSDSTKYRCFGNSVAVPCIEWIAAAVKTCLSQ